MPFPLNPGIKWVNDIYMSTSGNYEYKKVAGILTEAITDFESGQIDSVIIGIGINCSGSTTVSSPIL